MAGSFLASHRLLRTSRSDRDRDRDLDRPIGGARPPSTTTVPRGRDACYCASPSSSSSSLFSTSLRSEFYKSETSESFRHASFSRSSKLINGPGGGGGCCRLGFIFRGVQLPVGFLVSCHHLSSKNPVIPCLRASARGGRACLFLYISSILIETDRKATLRQNSSQSRSASARVVSYLLPAARVKKKRTNKRKKNHVLAAAAGAAESPPVLNRRPLK